MKNNSFYTVLSLGITLLLCSACSLTSSTEPNTTSTFDYRILETLPVKEYTHQQTLLFNGVVSVNEDQLYQYKAPEEGIVEQIHFSIGDYIKQGDPLLTFKSPNYNELQKELQASKQKVAIQQRSFTSAKSLYQDQLLSEEEYLLAQANLELAQQELSQLINTATLYGTPVSDNLFLICAKQSGYVIQKEITPYLAVSKEEQLLSIANLSTLWVKVQIHPNQIPWVKKGSEVTIYSSTYSNETFTGHITQLSPVIDPQHKVLHALIVVDNKEQKLKPAMHVEVEVKLDSEEQKIAVPTEALIFDDNQQQVVVKEQNNYTIKKVSIANTYQEHTFIDQGLTVGDTVITKNNLLIYNHLKNRSR